MFLSYDNGEVTFFNLCNVSTFGFVFDMVTWPFTEHRISHRQSCGSGLLWFSGCAYPRGAYAISLVHTIFSRAFSWLLALTISLRRSEERRVGKECRSGW